MSEEDHLHAMHEKTLKTASRRDSDFEMLRADSLSTKSAPTRRHKQDRAALKVQSRIRGNQERTRFLMHKMRVAGLAVEVTRRRNSFQEDRLLALRDGSAMAGKDRAGRRFHDGHLHAKHALRFGSRAENSAAVKLQAHVRGYNERVTLQERSLSLKRTNRLSRFGKAVVAMNRITGGGEEEWDGGTGMSVEEAAAAAGSFLAKETDMDEEIAAIRVQAAARGHMARQHMEEVYEEWVDPTAEGLSAQEIAEAAARFQVMQQDMFDELQLRPPDLRSNSGTFETSEFSDRHSLVHEHTNSRPVGKREKDRLGTRPAQKGDGDDVDCVDGWDGGDRALPTCNPEDLAATRMQAATRGYLAREEVKRTKRHQERHTVTHLHTNEKPVGRREMERTSRMSGMNQSRLEEDDDDGEEGEDSEPDSEEWKDASANVSAEEARRLAALFAQRVEDAETPLPAQEKQEPETAEAGAKGQGDFLTSAYAATLSLFGFKTNTTSEEQGPKRQQNKKQQSKNFMESPLELLGGGFKGGILGASPSPKPPQELTSDEEDVGEEWADPTATLDHESAAAAAATFLRRVESGIDGEAGGQLPPSGGQLSYFLRDAHDDDSWAAVPDPIGTAASVVLTTSGDVARVTPNEKLAIATHFASQVPGTAAEDFVVTVAGGSVIWTVRLPELSPDQSGAFTELKEGVLSNASAAQAVFASALPAKEYTVKNVHVKEEPIKLPNGWAAARANGGRLYFYNEASRVCTWAWPKLNSLERYAKELHEREEPEQYVKNAAGRWVPKSTIATAEMRQDYGVADSLPGTPPQQQKKPPPPPPLPESQPKSDATKTAEPLSVAAVNKTTPRKTTRKADLDGSGRSKSTVAVAPGGLIPLNHNELLQAKQVFAEFELDGSGSISVMQVGEALKKMDMKLKKKPLAKLIGDADLNLPGQLDFGDFVEVRRPLAPPTPLAKQYFTVLLHGSHAPCHRQLVERVKTEHFAHLSDDSQLIERPKQSRGGTGMCGFDSFENLFKRYGVPQFGFPFYQPTAPPAASTATSDQQPQVTQEDLSDEEALSQRPDERGSIVMDRERGRISSLTKDRPSRQRGHTLHTTTANSAAVNTPLPAPSLPGGDVFKTKLHNCKGIMGLGVDKDNFVTSLKPGTPAAEPGAGLQVGDRLLSVDGVKLEGPLAQVIQLADTHCFVVERLPPDTDSDDEETG